jgi:hypothetical protein
MEVLPPRNVDCRFVRGDWDISVELDSRIVDCHYRDRDRPYFLKCQGSQLFDESMSITRGSRFYDDNNLLTVPSCGDICSFLS